MGFKEPSREEILMFCFAVLATICLCVLIKFEGRIQGLATELTGVFIELILAVAIFDQYRKRMDYKKEAPNIMPLAIIGDELLVKNIGERVATKVMMVYSKESSPSAFSANIISSAQEIYGGVEYRFKLNLFSGIDMLKKLPNSEEGYKEKLDEAIKKFDSGERCMIPKFNIKYFDGEIEITSNLYGFIVERGPNMSVRLMGLSKF